CTDTCFDVGTTTIRFGVNRHGPLAPDAFQFGKYDDFTTTGTPMRSTSKEMRSSVARMRETLASGTGWVKTSPIVTDVPTFSPFYRCSCTRTRGQSRGPSDASGTA